MAGYQPLYISGPETGLVQERQEFLLPPDAYPILQNAYVWRERIKRKNGYRLLGRLRRLIVGSTFNVTLTLPSPRTINLITRLGLEATAEIEPGNITPIVITFGGQTLTDSAGLGVFSIAPPGNITAATINYATSVVTLTFTAGTGALVMTVSLGYYPSLPAMGLRDRELNNINQTQTVAFDPVYAYIFSGSGWQEFIPGTVWTGSDSNFFWSTNYWVTPGTSPNKLLWVTNFSGIGGDPIRYTDGSAWYAFAPTIDAVGTKLQQCLALLPFRGRLMVFNTLEGATLGGATPFTNRIRWSAIGNPISDTNAAFPPGTVNATAWRDDIRGQGGFLDIPTSQSITSVGFVRDNLVIYCERSTWQLRYTGRAIAPFQIERVNTELGATSTFSAVQFDTSLVGVGDKGVVECDSFKAERIDVKIPDLVYYFNNNANDTTRVHGIRDFQQRLAYWTYPYVPGEDANSVTYPNRRLVYNYENDSWAIFTDSLTCLGNFQNQGGETWASYATKIPGNWETQNYPWINWPALFPEIIGGNQQGWIEVLTGNTQVSNDVSLAITGISGNTTSPTVITSVNHNLENGQIIEIFNIPAGTSFASDLNGNSFYVEVIDANSFQIWEYNPESNDFDVTPEIETAGTYIGGGQIAIRDNFRIVSKKFSFIEEGQNIQIGFIDVLMNATSSGAITLNVYLDYQTISQNFSDPPNASNVEPQNNIPGTVPPTPDTFFNSIVPTSTPNPNGISGTKYWQRVFCATRAAFLTLEWTLSNAQMVGVEQQQDVQIDAQIIYMRKAGRQLPMGA